MARPEPLAVWLHGLRIGTLTSTGRPYDLSLRYSDEALGRWPGNTPLLSCSLPLSNQKLNAREYCRGLLPEAQQLNHLASRAHVTVTDLHGLLKRYGRDVAGAVAVLPEGEDPSLHAGGAVPYDEASLAEEVAALDDEPLAIHDDSMLSLPGLQNKLLLILDGGVWCRPTGGRPSTHIVKSEDRRFPGLVTLEAAGMTMARRIGLTSVDVEVVTLGNIDCLIVSRYDRARDVDGAVVRVHQEDVCQALGHNYEAKYEHGGGPGLASVAQLLERHATDPVRELTALVQVVTFNTVLGNADAHAKNISLVHRSPGQVELAPLYDTVPTALFPTLPDRAAMYVNRQTRLSRVTVADVVAEAARWSLSRDTAAAAAQATVTGMLAHLDGLPGELADLVSVRAERFTAPTA
jgi:serine/threonine-protein kinase HipA